MSAQNTLSATYQSIAQAAAKDESFVNFDLHLSPEARSDIERLNVERIDSYDNFGHTDSVLEDSAKFLESLGNDPALSRRVAETIDQLVKDSLSAVNAETAWFTIRAFTPIDDFDIPRWHTDGTFYDKTDVDQRKVAMTLKGPGTLLNNLPQSLRQTFNSVARSFESDSPENRRTLEKLVDPVNTQAGTAGQGTIFIVGSDERAAVHSEPPIHSERLFMSLLPGTREQIAELRERWGAPYTTYKPAQKPMASP